jgi:signal transduction histidine kinase
VTLEIRDYGIGIEEDKLELLGRPFVQGETHMVRTYAGIGLGLAISRGLMNLMNGTLNISSQEGIGTIVTLKLERVRAPLMAKKAA